MKWKRSKKAQQEARQKEDMVSKQKSRLTSSSSPESKPDCENPAANNSNYALDMSSNIFNESHTYAPMENCTMETLSESSPDFVDDTNKSNLPHYNVRNLGKRKESKNMYLPPFTESGCSEDLYRPYVI